jgi:hypothetical protein
MQFGLSCLKVNIAERLKTSNFQAGKFDKHAPIPSKPLKVNVTLPIQIGAHLLNLKIGHIAYPPAQSAFMRAWAVKLKTLNQTAPGKHLSWYTYNLAQTHIAGIYANNVCAACNPDIRLVFAGS